MRRGKVVLEKIENSITRQVTLSKRKSGIFKKASELSILCDADVALLLFSSRGKLHCFSTSDLIKIIERYRQCCYISPDGNNSGNVTQTVYQERLKLRATYESLQRTHRHLLGEDIEPLNVKELQSLEKQLDKALSKTRQGKTKMMLDHLQELHGQVKDLSEINQQLKSKLEAEQSLQAIEHTAVAPAPTLQIWNHQFVQP